MDAKGAGQMKKEKAIGIEWTDSTDSNGNEQSDAEYKGVSLKIRKDRGYENCSFSCRLEGERRALTNGGIIYEMKNAKKYIEDTLPIYIAYNNERQDEGHWQKEMPTEDKWYWLKQEAYKNPMPAQITKDRIWTTQDGIYNKDEYDKVTALKNCLWWSKSIEMPDPPKDDES